MSEKEVNVWAAAQGGERLQRATPDDLQGVVRESPWIPEEVVEVLDILKREYDPEWNGREGDPRLAENTQRYQDIVARWTSLGLSKAMKHGNDRMINAWLGVVEEETDIDGISSMIRFARWTTREAGITYLAGHMGSGKTDFGLLMLEVFFKQLKGAEKDVKIATNVKSTAEFHEEDPDIKFIGSQPDLQDWLETPGMKMFLFDEASSHASGYSGDASKVTKQMRSMVRLIRKSDASMTIIGHDGKDLHPTIRELADYVEKEGKKDAAAFENVQDREGEDKKFDISAIPETNLYFDTKEASSWEWAKDDGEDGKTLEVIAGETYEQTGLTQREVGEIFDMSQSQVSDAKREYREWKAAEA